MDSLGRLDANLQALRRVRTGAARRSSAASRGWGSVTAPVCFQDLAELDDLADQLSQSYDGARMDDVDLDALARQLGDDAAVSARTLQELERALRDSGYLKRTSDGQLRLSPKAMRQLGKALLRDVANRLSGSAGPARPAPGRCRRGAVRRDPASGPSATPSRGTSPAR